MKVALFIFLVLMNCSTLFAYEVNVTKLTDEYFDPLPKETSVFSGDFTTYKEFNDQDDKQIATITLVFGFEEIGKDYDAVEELAKKEAEKLGADEIYQISGTVYKNTEDIASMTFRCVRTPYCDILAKNILNEKELLKSSVICNKLHEVMKRFFWWKGGTPDKILSLIGVKRETILKENKKITVFYDIKSKKQLDKDEIFKRWLDGYANEVISVYKENLDLYISEYDKIIQIIKKGYPDFDAENNRFYPKPDAQKNINFQKFKDSFLLYYKDLSELFYRWCL